MTALAVAAVAAALGGVTVLRWQRADEMLISLIRDDAVCREAEVEA